MTSPLRLAMLGMIPGNGHPYSWSAIVNGFDPEAMAACPYPVIPRYLGAQPARGKETRAGFFPLREGAQVLDR